MGRAVDCCTWPKLLKDGYTDLFEAELNFFCLNGLDNQRTVDLDVIEV